MSDQLTQPFVNVAVDAPLHQSFLYAVPEGAALSRGQVVGVPFGTRSRICKGVILSGESEKKGDFKVKSVSEIYDDLPQLHEGFLQWLEWLSEYYLYPLGAILPMCLPPILKKSARALKHPSPLNDSKRGGVPPKMNSEQEAAISAIKATHGRFAAHLVFGITGSGKTEVYLHALDELIKNNKKGLVLVPEIALTPQLLDRFSERFGADKIAAIHSQLTPRERSNMWWKILDGTAQILVGARSALFCPIADLALIIVDEEHEASFKQDDHLRYNARDSAVMLAKFSNCPIILGSATPSLETWNNAVSGKFMIHHLQQKAVATHPPVIEVIDMREAKSKSQNEEPTSRIVENHEQLKVQLPEWLSERLFLAIDTTLKANKQVALFLNRRGVANVLLCSGCGYAAECPNCDIHLTLHGRNHLVCHYCDYHQMVPSICPECKEFPLKSVGTGTEKIQSDLEVIFPRKRIFRADRDEIQSRQHYEGLVREMENQNIDILVGTQMIAKGLDFPHLQTVGLILADIGMNIPDFRATERVYQLITQMAGRAGRHSLTEHEAGLVLIQTFNPAHPAIAFALSGRYSDFAQHEMQVREQFHYPPFGHLVSIKVHSLDKNLALSFIKIVVGKIENMRSQDPGKYDLEILGPVPAPLSKLNNIYRFQFMLKGSKRNRIHGLAAWIFKNFEAPPKVKFFVDVDPINLM